MSRPKPRRPRWLPIVTFKGRTVGIASFDSSAIVEGGEA